MAPQNGYSAALACEGDLFYLTAHLVSEKWDNDSRLSCLQPSADLDHPR